jgi:hypothetical protein
MVIFTLDSASRVAILNGGRGMFEMIRTDIGAWLAWAIFLPTVLVNIIVNMSQMSALVEGIWHRRPAAASLARPHRLIAVTLVSRPSRCGRPSLVRSTAR